MNKWISEQPSPWRKYYKRNSCLWRPVVVSAPSAKTVADRYCKVERDKTQHVMSFHAEQHTQNVADAYFNVEVKKYMNMKIR